MNVSLCTCTPFFLISTKFHDINSRYCLNDQFKCKYFLLVISGNLPHNRMRSMATRKLSETIVEANFSRNISRDFSNRHCTSIHRWNSFPPFNFSSSSSQFYTFIVSRIMYVNFCYKYCNFFLCRRRCEFELKFVGNN